MTATIAGQVGDPKIKIDALYLMVDLLSQCLADAHDRIVLLEARK